MPLFCAQLEMKLFKWLTVFVANVRQEVLEDDGPIFRSASKTSKTVRRDNEPPLSHS